METIEVDVSKLVDTEEGSVATTAFTDERVYQLELERVFARTWLYLGHESSIPKAGDYITAFMGEDPVVVVRQKDRSIVAFLNQCRHRGMRLCRADAGKARGFTCTYHGWSYDLEGKLVSVPQEERGYGNRLNKEEIRAHKVPHVHSHRGLIFGNWDEEALPFEEYLGDMAWYFDSLVNRYERTEVLGEPTRWTIECNWKVAAEQFASDMYHVEMTHVSAMMAQAGENGSDNEWMEGPGAQFSAPNGHGAGFFLQDVPDLGDAGPVAVEYVTKHREIEVERLGELRANRVRGHSTIFPNFSFLVGTNTIRVWHPKGPDGIEVWTWTLVDAEAPEEVKEGWRKGALRTFSPGGIYEQDDGENWSETQKVLRGHIARKTRINMSMGVGTAGDHVELPGRITDVFSEEAARGFYSYWAELMSKPPSLNGAGPA